MAFFHYKKTNNQERPLCQRISKRVEFIIIFLLRNEDPFFSMLQDYKSHSDIEKEIGRRRSTIIGDRERNCFKKYDLSYSGIKAHGKAEPRCQESHKRE